MTGIKGKKISIRTVEKELIDIYDLLLSAYGPRFWWPAETTLEMVFGAILVQNVTWKSVAEVINKMNTSGLLDSLAILKTENEYLYEIIRASRYYRNKAKSLKEFSKHLQEKYDGNIERLLAQRVETLREELLDIYGIGNETADSIILYGSGQPVFVVDAYTRRIFNRLGFFERKITYKSMQEYFSEALHPDVEMYKEYHALLVYHGSRVCLAKKPQCFKCALKPMCEYYKTSMK